MLACMLDTPSALRALSGGYTLVNFSSVGHTASQLKPQRPNSLMKLFSFKSLRVLTLLIVLATVAIYTKGQRLSSQGWYQPLPVSLFPINADDSIETTEYIAALNTKVYAEVGDFMERESKKYKIVTSTPTQISLGPVVHSQPPPPPSTDSNALFIMLWSLRLRWWAYLNTPDDLSNKRRVRIFVLYQQGKEGVPLAHSLGLQKGLIGIVHAFARTEQNAQNNIVITHELLHTVGATDKYADDGLPRFPEGYAEPHRNPRFPQRRAEIMAGRIPISATQWKMPASLRHMVVGPETAQEIKWIASTKY